jgi:hypothetical protein
MQVPIRLELVPGLLRVRGLEVSPKRIQAALHSGAIPGRRDGWQWTLTDEAVEAAERYFRELAARGAWKGGAAALQRAKGIGRQQ